MHRGVRGVGRGMVARSAAFLPLLCALAAPAAAEPLSNRAASYRIAVALDPARHTFSGEQTLTWRNATSAPTRICASTST